MTAERSSEDGTPAAKRQDREDWAPNLTVQVFISFPDSGFPDIVFDVSTKSLVADAAQAAADEWGADADFLEISFCESVIPFSSLLVSHGVEGGSQLTASLLQVFGCEWFTDDDKREKLMQHLSKVGEQHLSLDTPTFATDGCFRFDMAWIPDGFEISFVNPHPSITSAQFRQPIANAMFGSYSTEERFPVRKVDLSGLKNIKSTGSGFLLLCSSITTLDVSCLSSVTTIGTDFLCECSSLTSLDLSGLTNVTSIGAWFMAECSSLTSADLSGLKNITEIGSCFLDECSSLSVVNLSGLTSVTSIDRSFLRGCEALRSVELSGLTNAASIGYNFLSGCSSLTSVDLSCLSNLTSIGPCFLNRCSSLTTVDLSGLNNVTSISEYILDKCSPSLRVNVASLNPMSAIRKVIDEGISTDKMKFEVVGL